jgi:Ca2+-binding RTX toxin-like protein
MDFTPGRDGDAPMADASVPSGDNLRITGATTIGYREIEFTNSDGQLVTGTLLYDGADPNGRIFGFLHGFTGPLFLSDFTGDVTTVTAIDDSNGLTLTGGTGRDRLYGGAGDDTLDGGAGWNRLHGGVGDDIFDISDSHGAHSRYHIVDWIMDFTPGRDGDAPLADASVPSGDKIRITGATTIGYREIEFTNSDGQLVTGTLLYDGADPNGRIFGFLHGFTGPLFLSDFTGDVTGLIDGNNGLTLTGGPWRDYLYGGAGDDTLNGGTENDFLYGGAGDDTLNGGAGGDDLYGGAGDDIFDISDTFRAHSRYDYVDRIMDFTPGRDGDTPLADASVPSGDKIRIAGATTIGYRVIDRNGNGRADGAMLYDGTDPNGRIFGYLKGFTGPLFLSDFTGDVTGLIDGNNGLTLTGGDGVDYIYGGAGDDTLNGGAGRNTLYGGAGDDTLTGGAGRDWLLSGAGADTLNGGRGIDYFHVRDVAATLDRADRITDFGVGGEGDRVDVGSFNGNREPVWFRRFDADGDGDTDTVLYDNADANGGIYAILLDYDEILTSSDVLSAITVTEIA